MTTKNDSKTGEGKALRVGKQAIIPNRRDPIVCSTQREAQEIVDGYNQTAARKSSESLVAAHVELVAAADALNRAAIAMSKFNVEVFTTTNEITKETERVSAIRSQISKMRLDAINFGVELQRMNNHKLPTLNAAQRKLKIAIDARDSVRNMAATNVGWEGELHIMANRLDVMAKDIGMTELMLKS